MTRALSLTLAMVLGATVALAGACARAPGQATVGLTAEERAWAAAHGPIRLASDPAFPPLEWFDEQGAFRGLSADYFALIEERLGLPVEIVRMASWEEGLRQARERRIDGITLAQPTPQRSTHLSWSPTVIDVPNVIIVRGGSRLEPSLAGLSGKRVAVTAGHELEQHLSRTEPGIQLVRMPDDRSCLLAVSFGGAEATVVSLAIASYLIEKNGITNLKVAADARHGYALAIATRSDQPLLGAILAKGLAAVTPEERKAIRERWIRIDPGQFAQLAGGIAHDFNNLLTGILGNLSLVQSDDPPPGERSELLAEAQAAARRAQALTRQLLTFSRGGAPAKALVDVVPIVREAATYGRPPRRHAGGALDAGGRGHLRGAPAGVPGERAPPRGGAEGRVGPGRPRAHPGDGRRGAHPPRGGAGAGGAGVRGGGGRGRRGGRRPLRGGARRGPALRPGAARSPPCPAGWAAWRR